MTRTELDRLQEEHKALIVQANDVERMNADRVREAESAVAAVRQAQDEAEHERQANELHILRLKEKAAQVAKQHNAMQHQLKVAKDNAGALQERIDVYQRKIRDGAATALPAHTAEPAVHKPFDPSTIPPPHELPTRPTVEPPKPVTAQTPLPAATPAKRAEEPAVEPGWIDSIKNWLVYLWRSVF